MSKPAASTGDGAARRSIFRPCKQTSKASTSRAEPGQSTLQNPPHSDPDSDGGRSENRVSDSDDSLVLSAVSREAGDLVPVQHGGIASAAVSCEHNQALGLPDEVFAPRQDLGDGNLVPRESSLAAAESGGLSPTNPFLAEAVDGQASNQVHSHIVQSSAYSTITPTSATSAPEVRAFASYASIVQSSSAGHVPSAHHTSASPAEHVAPAVHSDNPVHPAPVTQHYERPPDDSLVPILSTASPIIQGLSSQLARI